MRLELVFLLCCAAMVMVIADPVVHAPSGPVKGLTRQGIDEFLGIPFAQPPVGDLRWTAPRAKTWSEVLPTQAFQDTCMENVSPTFKIPINISEDCLYLNVWRRSGASASKQPLPVMVWIYGGSYTGGSATFYPLFDMLHKSTEDVILVSLNYRVNGFGFMDFEEENMNFGLLDQQLALKWVSENIAAFGGDPSRVTIFGESAGGNSVSMHLMIPSSFSLYQRAILESPAPWVYKTRETMGQARDGLAVILNCSGGNMKEKARCMRAVPAPTLLKAINRFGVEFQPIVGGDLVPVQPYQAWVKNAVNQKADILVGNNRDEGNVFAFQMAGGSFFLSKSDFLQKLDWFISRYGDELKKKVLDLYAPLMTSDNYFHVFALILQDVGINCGTRNVALQSLKRQGGQTYRYLFSHSTSKWALQGLNATHTAEIPYVMRYPGLLNATFTDGEKQLAARMSGDWIHFAAQGKPKSAWPPYQPETHTILDYNLEDKLVGEGDLYARCPFWDEVLKTLPSDFPPIISTGFH